MRESLRAGGDSGFVLKERVVRAGVGRGRAWVVVCVVYWAWGGGVGACAEFGVGTASEYFVEWRSVRVCWRVVWRWGGRVDRGCWVLVLVRGRCCALGSPGGRCE